jgi:hypothetical protein
MEGLMNIDFVKQKEDGKDNQGGPNRKASPKKLPDYHMVPGMKKNNASVMVTSPPHGSRHLDIAPERLISGRKNLSMSLKVVTQNNPSG